MKQTFTYLFMLFTTFSFSQGIAIYVSDAGNFTDPPWQILKFDGEGNNPEVFIDTLIDWPQDILFLEDSNVVLISNFGSNSILKFNANDGSYISTFASGISGPTRIKIGADNLLYVLQWGGNGKVKRFELDGTYVDDFTSNGVDQSIGIDWDSEGNLYVSSYTDDIVRKFDSEGNDLGIFVNSELTGPTNIWFDENGDLLVIDYDGSAVKRFDSDGNYIEDFISGLSHAEGVDFFSNGNILIGNGASSSVKMYDSEGNYIEDIVTSGSGNLLRPNAVRIRGDNIASVSEHDGLKKDILYPSLGSFFYVKMDYVEKIKTIKVFDLKGTFIEELEGTQLNAGSYSEGSYILNIEFIDSTLRWQKIIVRK